MENLSKKVAKKLYDFKTHLDYLFRIKNQISNRKKISILISLLFPALAILSFYSDIPGGNFIDQLLFLSLIIPAIWLLFFLINIFLNYKEIKQDEFSKVNFKELNLYEMDGRFFQFNEKENKEFQKLILFGKVDFKIDWKFTAKNPSQPNFRKLFCLFHVITTNGVLKLNPKEEEELIQTISNSFTALGNDINIENLEKYFDSWKDGFTKDSSEDFMDRLKIEIKVKE